MKTLKGMIVGFGIIGTAAAAIFGGLYLDNYIFNKLRVGDKMPKFSNENIMGHQPWHNATYSKYGDFIFYKKEASDDEADLIVNLSCNGKKFVFGYYDFGSDILYLDNNPNDGVIDEIIKNLPKRDTGDDAPDCPRKQL